MTLQVHFVIAIAHKPHQRNELNYFFASLSSILVWNNKVATQLSQLNTCPLAPSGKKQIEIFPCTAYHLSWHVILTRLLVGLHSYHFSYLPTRYMRFSFKTISLHHYHLSYLSISLLTDNTIINVSCLPMHCIRKKQTN